MDLRTASFRQISEAVAKKKISALETAQHFLQRAKELNPHINAFITFNDQIESDAKSLDEKMSKGASGGALAGIPLGIKDMLCTKGLRTTAGSKILENFIPPYDSTVTEKLKNAGALILGKLNQDEFAMGSSNETSYFGPCRNPWNTQCVAGGSSGGSAAAQAARLVAGTVGTDTGGSIRQPANFCGVVGVKPTYGRVSRYGIIAYASSLDQAGPIVSCVEDAALMLEVICGRDSRDSTTSDREVPSFSLHLKPSMTGLRIGILKEYMNGKIHPAVQQTFEAAVEAAQKSGAELVELSSPLIEQAVPIYYLIASSEASSNLARYDGVKYGYRTPMTTMAALDLDEFYMKTRGEGFGPEVKRRIMLGTYCLSSGYYDAFYNKACQVRRLLKDQMTGLFEKCDVILSPVTTSPAFKIGERIADPLTMYLNDIFTVSTNLAGLPGMSVPFGRSPEGLPIGIQLTAGHFQEQTLLNAGMFFEEASSQKWKVADV